MIAHEKRFIFHAQPQTGAYSCSRFYSLPILSFRNTAGFSPVPRMAVLGGTTVTQSTPAWTEEDMKKDHKVIVTLLGDEGAG